MTTSIRLSQGGTKNAKSLQLIEDLYETYKSAERCLSKGGDPSFIPDSLCRLHTPIVLGSKPREKRMTAVKQALQPAVPAHAGILAVLIQVLFSRFTGQPLCPFASSLSEEERKEFVIQEIVNVHDQVASGIVTDYTLVADCLCTNLAEFIISLKRFNPHMQSGNRKLSQRQFGYKLQSYGIECLNTRMKQASYVNNLIRHPTRREISDAELRGTAIYFLLDPTWRWRWIRADFMNCLRRLRANNSAK